MLSFSVNAPVKLCHEKDIAASDEPTDGDQHLGVFQLTVFDFGLAISATNNLISSYSRQLTVPLYPDQRWTSDRQKRQLARERGGVLSS